MTEILRIQSLEKGASARRPLRSGHIVIDDDEIFLPEPKQVNASRSSAERLRKFLVASVVCRSHLLIDFSQSRLLAGYAGTPLNDVLAQTLGRALSGFSVCHFSLDGASKASDLCQALKLHLSNPSPTPSSRKTPTKAGTGRHGSAKNSAGRRVGSSFAHAYTTTTGKGTEQMGNKKRNMTNDAMASFPSIPTLAPWHDGLVLVLQDLDCASSQFQSIVLETILTRIIPGTATKLPTPFMVVAVIGRRVRTRQKQPDEFVEREAAPTESDESGDEDDYYNDNTSVAAHTIKSPKPATKAPLSSRFRRRMHRHARAFQNPEITRLHRWLQDRFLFRYCVPSGSLRPRAISDPLDSSSSLTRGYSSTDSGGGRSHVQPRAVQLHKALVPHHTRLDAAFLGAARAAMGDKDYAIRRFPLTSATVVSLMELRSKVFVSCEVEQFVADLIIAVSTADSQAFMMSPHSRRCFLEALQAIALIEGKMFVTIAAINEVAIETLGPRLIRRSLLYAPSPLSGLGLGPAAPPTKTLLQHYKDNQSVVRDAHALVHGVVLAMNGLR